MEDDMSSLQVLLTAVHQIDASLRLESIPKKVILLMGQTKAGKTTLFYYLSGKKLVFQKNEIDVWQLVPEANFSNAYIGEGYESTTVYPNIPPWNSDDDIMVIDMPGFDDNRPHYRLLNIYILLQTLQLLREVHICHVIPFQCCESDALIREFQKIGEVFNKNIVFANNNLSFILTKVEREDIVENFLSQIDDLLEMKLVDHLIEELHAFKTKHIYTFENREPKIQEGLQLKQRISVQNSFFKTDHQPNQILSDTYSREMIGKTNIQQFQDYLIQIIKHIKNIIEPLVNATVNIFLFQFQKIIKASLTHNHEEFLQGLRQKIKESTLKINLYELAKFKLKQNNQKQINEEYCATLLKCFRKVNRSKQERNYLIEVLQYFSSVISLIRKNHPLLDNEYLSTIQNCLKQTSSLVSIIMEVHLQLIQQAIKEVTTNQNLINVIDNHYNFWEVNNKAIVNSQLFKEHSKNEEVIQLMSEQIQIIEKVYKYSEIRSKQANNIIAKRNFNISKPLGSNKYQRFSQMSLDELEKNIKNLSISPESLKHLKDQFQLLKGGKEKWPIRKILNKISQIFYWFSFFEEAIMFKLCTLDENEIDSLLEEGMACEQFTIQFMTTILIPYYCYVNVSMSKLQTCYNYLFHTCLSPQEQLDIQKSRVQSIENLLQNPENSYLLLDRYKQLEFYYINPILQNFEYYLQLVDRKRQAFNRTPTALLTSFINKK